MMYETPLITIIIPCYNIGSYIDECMNSVLEQSIIGRCQVLCVDDGSTDDTRRHLDFYQNRNKKIVQVLEKKDRRNTPQNCGVSAARNLALDAARGQTIMFIDGDDLIGNFTEKQSFCSNKYYLEEFYETLVNNPDAGMVLGKIQYTNPQTKQLIKNARYSGMETSLYSKKMSNPEEAINFIDHRISSCGALFRADLINTGNPQNNLRFYQMFKYFEDANFITEYAFRALSKKFRHIFKPAPKDTCYAYVTRKGSAMSRINEGSERDMLRLNRTYTCMLHYSKEMLKSGEKFDVNSSLFSWLGHRFTSYVRVYLDKYASDALNADAYYAMFELIPEECLERGYLCTHKTCGQCVAGKKLLEMCQKYQFERAKHIR